MTLRVHLPPPPTVDRTFRALGTDVRLVVVGRRAADLVDRAEAEIVEYDERLSRFRPESELCALNADPRETVPASPLLREAVSAALGAARASGGLVDPTLLDALERAGYTRSLAGERGRPVERGRGVERGRPVHRGREVAPPRPAAPHPAARWRTIAVGPTAISRPPGLRLDLGGSGKGHAADRVARLLSRAERWTVDCGGDVRVGGEQEVHVAHPTTGAIVARLRLAAGAVATSSTVARAWTTDDGRRAHHLIDPATGAPAHTGLIAATALGRTTLEAETRAKVALLQGPGTRHGAILVHAGGRTERVR